MDEIEKQNILRKKAIRIIVIAVGTWVICSALLLAYIYYYMNQSKLVTPKTFAEYYGLSGSKIMQTDPRQCVSPNGTTITESENINLGSTMRITTLFQGTSLPVDIDTQQLVIKDKKVIEDKLKEYNLELATLAIPSIDFTKEMVLVVFAGQKPSGGYEIQITKVEEKVNALEVTYTETVPGDNCFNTMALTSPYHMVKVERSDKEVVFKKEVKTSVCE